MGKMMVVSALLSAMFISVNGQEWEELFNGKNLNGWKQLNGKGHGLTRGKVCVIACGAPLTLKY